MKIARNTVIFNIVCFENLVFRYNVCAIVSMEWTHVVVAVLLHHGMFTCYLHIYVIICYSLFI